jgi:hypothetical protein
MLNQELQGAGVLVVGPPRAEPVAVRDEQFQHERRVRRIVFGPRGRERLAVLRQRLGRDGEEGEEIVLQECVDERAARLLQAEDSHRLARLTLQRAVEVAQNAGDSEAAGLAALTIIEELAEHLPPHDLSATYDRAAELLSDSGNWESKDRLLACSRRVLFLVDSLPSPPTWKGFNFYDAVRRFKAGLIERALRDAGGVVARAAQLLGIERSGLGAMLHRGRHKALEHLRTPVEPRKSSLMFRDEVDCPETQAVSVLHVEDDTFVADTVRMTLDD